jgi:hypothetical protein
MISSVERCLHELNGLQSPVEPPTERETVFERVDQCLSDNMSSMHIVDNMYYYDLQTSSSHIGPSTTPSKSEIFSKENGAF